MDTTKILIDINHNLGELNAGVKAISNDTEEIRCILQDHEKRLRRLELIILPVVAVVAIMIPVIF